MEPVTHILTGACLARSGFNRRAAYATAAMAIAAEFPDIDTLWSLRGPVSGFEHHRGITHTLLGIPFEAALLLGLFALLHLWRRRAQRSHAGSAPTKPLTAAPVRWGLLYAFVLLALLSHIVLDYTNNYGVRPFFPFNPHWYAASIVFIFDPLIFVFLLAGLLLPSVFGLVSAEVGARRGVFRGAGWARAALAGIVMLWAIRGFEHNRALVLAQTETLQLPAAPLAGPTETRDTGDTPLASVPDTPPLVPQRSLASPDPLSIFRWYTATDFGPAYRLGTADTRRGVLAPGRTLFKPAPSPLIAAAKRSPLGRIYLDWSPMPWISIDSSDPGSPRPGEEIDVDLTDLRFMGSSPLILRGQHTPLTGTVVLSPSGQVLDQGMDGRFER